MGADLLQILESSKTQYTGDEDARQGSCGTSETTEKKFDWTKKSGCHGQFPDHEEWESVHWQFYSAWTGHMQRMMDTFIGNGDEFNFGYPLGEASFPFKTLGYDCRYWFGDGEVESVSYSQWMALRQVPE